MIGGVVVLDWVVLGECGGVLGGFVYVEGDVVGGIGCVVLGVGWWGFVV